MYTFKCEQNEKTKKWKYKFLNCNLYGNKISAETDFIFDTEDIAEKEAIKLINNPEYIMFLLNNNL